jgi:hypothetical protein
MMLWLKHYWRQLDDGDEMTAATSKPSAITSTTTVSAAVSAAIIAAIQYHYPNGPKEITATGSALIPMVVALVVSALQWMCAALGFKTTAELSAEKHLDRQIKFLREQIEIENNAGRNVSELKQKLNAAIIAKANLYEIESHKPTSNS